MPNLAKILSTFFYVGYLPKIQGSIASLLGMLIYYALREHVLICVLVWLLITICGFLLSGQMEKISQEKDPSCIVIDEVSGAMLAFFMLPFSPAICITGFFLFRAFDMFKIYPVNKFEGGHGAKGIMLDDLFAGLYTNITMQIAIRLCGIV